MLEGVRVPLRVGRLKYPWRDEHEQFLARTASHLPVPRTAPGWLRVFVFEHVCF